MDHHDHAHDHHHHEAPKNFNTAFIVGILLNSLFVAVEAIAGFRINSLSLLADAGHNLGDVAALLLAWLAAVLMKRKAFGRFTYGYKRVSILITFVNNLVLLVAIGAIAWEAIQRFRSPELTEGFDIALVALIGIVVNAVTAYLFYKGSKSDLNIRSAYLHMATDALVSLGVVIAGVLIHFTRIVWLDPAISIAIVVVIMISSWKFFRETAFIIMDAAPLHADVEKIRAYILNVDGVQSLHDLHIWKISTSQTALTAHIVLGDEARRASVLQNIRHHLEHEQITHVTLQLESPAEACALEDC